MRLGALVGAGVVLWALSIGLRPIGENSFLTHLATGRRIVQGLGFPHSDPYSFTARGEPWVVQSWLASTAYGALDAIGGPRALQLFTAMLMALIGWLVWRLTAPADGVIARLALAGAVVLVGAGQWVERPFLIGLVGLCLVLLAALDRLDPRWLVPVMWVWTCSHGSFPLAFVIVGAIALGARLDGEHPTAALRTLAWAALGCALAVVNPYGVRLLVFPVTLLQRSSVLAGFTEWQAPTFTSMGERGFLVVIVLGVVALRRAPSWRLALVLALTVPMALTSSRNLSIAAIAIVAVAAPALSGWGSLRSTDPVRRGGLVAVLLAAFAAAMVATALTHPASSYRGYPLHALAWLDREGLLSPDARIVARDYAGNFMTAAYGGTIPVFTDDRAEVYPISVMADAQRFTRLQPGVADALDRYDADVVLWPTPEPFAQALPGLIGWRVAYVDPEWTIAVRRAG